VTQYSSARRPVPPTRRDIDIAVGILVGLLGYSEREAFDELVRAVHRTGGGIASIARSLIAVAGGRHDAIPATAPYQAEILEIWGNALDNRPVFAPTSTLITPRAS
jgi:hypothetical protein